MHDIHSLGPTTTAGRATLGFVGDIMLGRGISALIGCQHPSVFWGDVLPLLQRADGVFANLESPLTHHRGDCGRTWKTFRFRAEPAALDLLTEANVRAVNLANNHILDCGEAGMRETCAHLSDAGIAFAGAGNCAEAALRPALFTLAGLRIGFLGFTDNLPAWAAGPARAGTNFLAFHDTGAIEPLLGHCIEALRGLDAQLIVLSLHWGPNLRTWPPARFRAFARRAIARGVDIVHGHSAHLVQGVERYGRGLVFYDTGDILNDYWVFPGVRIDRSFTFLLDLDDARPQRLRLVPVNLTPGRVMLARGGEFDAICQTMQRRSLMLGTNLRPSPQGLELPLAA